MISRQINPQWQRVMTGSALAVTLIVAVMLLETMAIAVLFAIVALLILWEWSRLLTSSFMIYLLLALALVGLMGWGWMHLAIDNTTAKMLLFFALGWWILMFVLIAIYRPEMRQQTWLAYLFILAAPLVIAAAWFAMVYLHQIKPLLLLYLFAIVVVSDTAAYYSGRMWGQRKLAPLVSPGKTVVGLYGALCGVWLLAAVVSWFSQATFLLRTEWVLISLLITLVCVIGDLAQSLIKRYVDKKDSGDLLPGHGGLFDRTDSLLAAAPIFLMTLQY